MGSLDKVYVFSNYRSLPGSEEALGSAMRRLAVKLRTESGCCFLHVYASVSDPAHFMVHSCWTDEDSLNAATKLPYVVRFLDLIQPLINHQLNAVFMSRLD